MRRSVAAIALAVLAAGCGGPGPRAYDAGRSAASLQRVGWAVTMAADPPPTLAGGRQVGYLETTAPDTRRIDLQFLETPEAATAELAAHRRRAATFAGTTVGNVLVIPAAGRDDRVPEVDLAALRNRLQT